MTTKQSGNQFFSQIKFFIILAVLRQNVLRVWIARHCARATQLILKKCGSVVIRWQHCVRFDWPKIWLSDLPLQTRTLCIIPLQILQCIHQWHTLITHRYHKNLTPFGWTNCKCNLTMQNVSWQLTWINGAKRRVCRRASWPSIIKFFVCCFSGCFSVPLKTLLILEIWDNTCPSG